MTSQADAEHPALTAEDLAAIKRMAEQYRAVPSYVIAQLVAEVERLRQREAALREVEIAAESVVNVPKVHRQVAIDWLRQALERASLAQAEQP